MRYRFTVALHRLISGRHTDDGRGDHLDWFFSISPDASGPLLTWSTSIAWYRASAGHRASAGSRESDGPRASDVAARRLPDHRARYLDYDGDISGGRGQVQRLVTGTYQLREHDAERLEFIVYSVAIADVLAASSADQDLVRLAIELRNQLVTSKLHTIRLFSQRTELEG